MILKCFRYLFNAKKIFVGCSWLFVSWHCVSKTDESCVYYIHNIMFISSYYTFIYKATLFDDEKHAHHQHQQQEKTKKPRQSIEHREQFKQKMRAINSYMPHYIYDNYYYFLYGWGKNYYFFFILVGISFTALYFGYSFNHLLPIRKKKCFSLFFKSFNLVVWHKCYDYDYIQNGTSIIFYAQTTHNHTCTPLMWCLYMEHRRIRLVLGMFLLAFLCFIFTKVLSR